MEDGLCHEERGSKVALMPFFLDFLGLTLKNWTPNPGFTQRSCEKGRLDTLEARTFVTTLPFDLNIFGDPSLLLLTGRDCRSR